MISAVDSSLMSGSSIGSCADTNSSYAMRPSASASPDAPMTTTVPIDAAFGTAWSSGRRCASTTIAEGVQSVSM
jgi:hypothetical protein